MAKEILVVLLLCYIQHVLGFPMSNFQYDNSSNLIEIMKRSAFPQINEGYSMSPLTSSLLYDYFSEQTLQNSFNSPALIEQILKSKPNLQQYGTSNIESFQGFGQTDIFSNYLKEFAMKCLQSNPLFNTPYIPLYVCIPGESGPVIMDAKEDPLIQKDPEGEIKENEEGGQVVTDGDDTGNKEDVTVTNVEQQEDTPISPVAETNPDEEGSGLPITDTEKEEEENNALPTGDKEEKDNPEVEDAAEQETPEGSDDEEDPKANDPQVNDAVPANEVTNDKEESGVEDSAVDKEEDGKVNDDDHDDDSKKSEEEEISSNEEKSKDEDEGEDTSQSSDNDDGEQTNSNGENDPATKVQEPDASIDEEDKEEKEDDKDKDSTNDEKDITKEGESTATDPSATDETDENAPTDDTNQGEKEDPEDIESDKKTDDDNKSGDITKDDPLGDDEKHETETNTETSGEKETTRENSNGVTLEEMMQEMSFKSGNDFQKTGEKCGINEKCGKNLELICNIMHNLVSIAKLCASCD